MDKLNITTEEYQRVRNMLTTWSFTKLTFMDALEMIRDVDGAQTTPQVVISPSNEIEHDKTTTNSVDNDESISPSKRRRVIEDSSNIWFEYNTNILTFPICCLMPIVEKKNISNQFTKDSKEHILTEEEFCIDTGLCVIWG